MSNKEALRKIIDNYLVDDGLERDVVILAKQMGIDVGYQYFNYGEEKIINEYDFVAFIYIGDDRKVIGINGKCVNKGDISRFIVAYLLASYVNSDKDEFKSLFRIDEMNMDNYILAKKIIDRRNKYNKKRKKNKLLKLFRDN